MIRSWPVEPAAMDKKHVLFPEKIQYKLFVVMNMESPDIQLRKGVEGCLRLYNADAGDIIQHPRDQLALLIDPAAREQHRILFRIRCKGGRNDLLGRNIGTQPHGGEKIQAFNIVLYRIILNKFKSFLIGYNHRFLLLLSLINQGNSFNSLSLFFSLKLFLSLGFILFLEDYSKYLRRLFIIKKQELLLLFY